MNGTIFNIQKFCVNDGPGIRTTVFLKGCPLNCLWCHNPESKKITREMLFNSEKCTLCGRCAVKCENGAHIISESGHIYDREKCTLCGACTESCFTEALEGAGYEISAEDAIKDVLKDKIFYDNSGGGMTLSGGEPMLQLDFTLELLKRAKEEGLHTCMETCGFAKAEDYKRVAPLVDIFLFDYKVTNPEKHRECTGVSNEIILQNLRMLDDMGCKTYLRCPIIPTINDNEEHLFAIAELAEGLSNVIEVNIEPYHPLGSGKSEMLGRDYPLKDIGFPEESTVKGWIDLVASRTSVPVKKA